MRISLFCGVLAVCSWAKSENIWLAVGKEHFIKTLGPSALEDPIVMELVTASELNIFLVRNSAINAEEIDKMIEKGSLEVDPPLILRDAPQVVEDETQFGVLIMGRGLCAHPDPKTPVTTAFIQTTIGGDIGIDNSEGSRKYLEATVDFCYCSYRPYPFGQRLTGIMELLLVCPEVHGDRSDLKLQPSPREAQDFSSAVSSGLDAADGTTGRPGPMDANSGTHHFGEQLESLEESDKKDEETTKKFLSPTRDGPRTRIRNMEIVDRDTDLAAVADIVEGAPNTLKNFYKSLKKPAGGHYAGFFGRGDSRYGGHGVTETESTEGETETQNNESTEIVKQDRELIGLWDYLPGGKSLKKVYEINRLANAGDYKGVIKLASALPSGVVSQLAGMIFNESAMKVFRKSGLFAEDEKEVTTELAEF